MKITAFTPIKNEVDFVGYMIMSVLPTVHEIILGCAPSTDGTDELLDYIKATYAGEKLKLVRDPVHAWNRTDEKAYNASYNDLIERATGDAVWYLHADMVCENPEAVLLLKPGPLAWYVHVRSFAGTLDNEIVSGRATTWKTIHMKKFGLHYAGAYGSHTEDLYFRDITGKAQKHYGEEFRQYPFEVADSGLLIYHYCEMKSYSERLKKMKICLKAQYPQADERWVNERAAIHPRVTLDSSANFVFEKTADPKPSVFDRYANEFEPFKRRTPVHA